jgi:hypothetical protein
MELHTKKRAVGFCLAVGLAGVFGGMTGCGTGEAANVGLSAEEAERRTEISTLDRFFQRNYKAELASLDAWSMTKEDRVLALRFAGLFERGHKAITEYREAHDNLRYVSNVNATQQDDEGNVVERIMRVDAIQNVADLNSDAEIMLNIFAAQVLMNVPHLTTSHKQALSSCMALGAQRNLEPRFTSLSDVEYQDGILQKLNPEEGRNLPEAYYEFQVTAHDVWQGLWDSTYKNVAAYAGQIETLEKLVPQLEAGVKPYADSLSPAIKELRALDRDLLHKSILMGLNLKACERAVTAMANRQGAFSDIPRVTLQENARPAYREAKFDMN